MHAFILFYGVIFSITELNFSVCDKYSFLFSTLFSSISPVLHTCSRPNINTSAVSVSSFPHGCFENTLVLTAVESGKLMPADWCDSRPRRLRRFDPAAAWSDIVSCIVQQEISRSYCSRFSESLLKKNQRKLNLEILEIWKSWDY